MNRLKRIMYSLLCWFFPVKNNKIVLSSYKGKGYSDNIKYIADRLLEYDDLDIYWIISEDKFKDGLPSKIKPIKINSFEYFYHHATAKVWIDNCRKAFYYKKRNQLYIQTWHGGGAQKRIEKDVLDKLGPNYYRGAKRDSNQIDIMISESRFLTNLYYNSFWYDGAVWECGYPRYDVLFNDHTNITNKVYNYYNIPKNKSIILYAPTFRVDHSIDVYNIDFNRIKPILEKKFNTEVVFLVRLHPNISDVETNFNFDNENIFNATLYPDAQELLCAASILIGDYSSINYDFALMGKPAFRYATDIEEYMKDRNFYLPFNKYPYPYATNNDELVAVLENFDYNEYKCNLNKFFDDSGLIINYNCSKEIAELINDFIHYNGNKKEFMKANSNKFLYKNK